ncbi:MAG TPA: TlpA disulfide reductase family protein [Polyangiaceae bacterium]
MLSFIGARPLGAFAMVVSCALAGCGGGASESEGPSAPAQGAVHPLIGKRGPEFAQKTVGGDATISLKGLSGKVTVVDFWATWCGPCKKSFPKLEAINAKYAPNGVEVVGISEDDDNSGIRAFQKGLGATFPVVWDASKSIASKWQPKSMPSTFILDRHGTIRYVHLGYHDHEEATIEREIQSLL